MNTKLRELEHRTINGDIYDYYESIIDRIFSSKYGSDTKFLSFDSSEPPCPIGPGQFTKLKLTDGSCTLTSFDTSFIKLRVTTTVSFTDINSGVTNWATNHDNTDAVQSFDNLPFIYVGLKSGLHLIDHYRFYCDKGRGYVCEQSQAIYESAITWFAKSKEEIRGNEGCYVTYKDLISFNKNIPGKIFTYKEVADAIFNKKTLPLDFEVIIKYDDFAPLQFFKIFPNSICGNLQLEFKINNNKNFVCAAIALQDAVDNCYSSGGGLVDDVFSGDNPTNKQKYLELMSKVKAGNYVRQFQNVGDPLTIVLPIFNLQGLEIQNINLITTTFQVNVASLRLESAKSYINGYNIDQDKIDELTALFTNHKVYIPGQRIDQYSFSQIPTKTNMNCNTTQTLINCSSIIFTWPRTQNQLTCSENPLCSSLQLQIDNKTYPDKPFSTTEYAHSNYILNNLMFDDIFKPNEALKNSLSLPWEKMHYDSSNYIFVVATERLDSDPFVFDGITKDNCFITLNGTFINESNYARSSSKMPPIMFLCQDTVWELSSEGVNYYYNDKNIIPSISNN